MWSCHSAQYKLCTAEYPFSYCSGGKYRIFLSWPIFLLGLILSIPALTTAGIVLFSLAVLFSACNSSGRIQCFLKSFKNAGKHRNFKPRGKQRCEEGSYSGSPYLCSSSCFFHLQLLRLIILSGGRRRMINGINSREMILEFYLKSKRASTATWQFGMPFPNISSFLNRTGHLLPVSVKERWNTGFRLITLSIFFQGDS